MFSNKIEGYRTIIKIAAVFIVIMLLIYISGSIRRISSFGVLKEIDEGEFMLEQTESVMSIRFSHEGINGYTFFDLIELPPNVNQMEYSPKVLFIYYSIFDYVYKVMPIILIMPLTFVFLWNIYNGSTPFIKRNAGLIKIVSYIVLLYGMFGRSIKLYFIHKYVFNFNAMGIRMYDADWLTITLGILLFLISIAFSYGIYLQEEFDDTI